MSGEIARNFIRSLDSNIILQNMVLKLRPHDLNVLLQIASEFGYHFSDKDWRDAIQSFSGCELDDAELELVAAGYQIQPHSPHFVGQLLKLYPGLA